MSGLRVCVGGPLNGKTVTDMRPTFEWFENNGGEVGPTAHVNDPPVTLRLHRYFARQDVYIHESVKL